jgi:tRNA (guanosine-2'-O-)-methyltransferase
MSLSLLSEARMRYEARMKRVSGEGGDVFKPKGQLKREIALAEQYPDEVVRILSAHLSGDRIKRIDRVAARRIRKQTVAIEGVLDPHNSAAVIRTAEAFGLQTVHVVEGAYRFLSSRKITQGTHKWVDLAVWKRPIDFERAVRKEGKAILIADAGADHTLYDIATRKDIALVFGNEHLGISDEMRSLADGAFSIPMTGFAESINVSVAASIAIAHICRAKTGDLGHAEQEVLRARFYLRAVRAGYDIVRRELGSIG